MRKNTRYIVTLKLWLDLPDTMCNPPCEHGSVVIGNSLFVIGGTETYQTTPLADVQEINLESQSWSTTTRMLLPVCSPIVVPHNLSIYVLPSTVNANNSLQIVISNLKIAESV